MSKIGKAIVVGWLAGCAVLASVIFIFIFSSSPTPVEYRVVEGDGECWVVPTDKTKFESLLHFDNFQECETVKNYINGL
jgi:hypothetical protein